MDFPYKFTTGAGPDLDGGLTVSILQGIPGFPFGAISDLETHKRHMFLLDQSLHRLLSLEPHIYYEIEYHYQGELTFGVLYNVLGTTYGCMPISRDYKTIGLSSKIALLSTTNATTFIDGLKVLKSENSLLTAAPTSKLIPKTSAISPERKKVVPETILEMSPEKSLSPTEYLVLRYFSTLYSLNTPLSYFLKTALLRFRNLCDCKEAEKTISQCILSINVLDERHGALGVASIEFQPQQQLELEHREAFCKKNAASENFSTLLNLLKVRETQLQMLLRLELVVGSGELHFFGPSERSKPVKKLLVRRKGRRIMPTFLGMGIGIENDNMESSDLLSDSSHSMRASINVLIDRLAIWDTLNNTSTLNDFLVHIVVPYFHKRIPLTIKYIIDRFKGPRIRSKVRGSRDEVPEAKHRSKYNKTLVRKRLPEKVGLEQLPINMLKRTKSNVTPKSLERREVDMTRSFTAVDSTLQVSRAKKTPSEPTRPIFTMKRSKTAPIQPLKAVEPQESSLISQVLQTPVKKRTVVMPLQTVEILSTPISQKLSALGGVTSSPIQSPERLKPGDPVLSITSPFFTSRLFAKEEKKEG